MTMLTKQKTTAIALALGAALVATSGTAMAFGGKGGHGMKGPLGGIFRMEFTQVDANDDGKITAEDLQAHGAIRFAQADANSDGELSMDEMKAQREAMKAKHMAEGGMGKDGKGKEHGEKRMNRMMEKMFSKRDADGNGTLSMAEMALPEKKMNRLIEHFDTNEDGSLSEAEFTAAKEKMAEKMKRRRLGEDGHGQQKVK